MKMYMKMKALKIKGIKLKKGEELLHYHKFCYCIAKHSNNSALFVIPPHNKGTVTDSGYVSVCFDKNVENVKVGDWCEVGYISTFESGTNRILSINKIHKDQ
jgi:hypothetical protein